MSALFANGSFLSFLFPACLERRVFSFDASHSSSLRDDREPLSPSLDAELTFFPLSCLALIDARKEDEGSDSDSDIEAGGVTQSFKCPLSLKTFVDPWSS